MHCDTFIRTPAGADYADEQNNSINRSSPSSFILPVGVYPNGLRRDFTSAK